VKQLALTLMAPIASLLMTAALFAHMHRSGALDDTEPYHQRARQAIENIPLSFGGWEGEEVRIPPAAGQLLRPNALISRNYQNRESGLWATLVVVHCRDPRDMSGHYPPNCYRGSGWMQGGPPEAVACELEDGAAVTLAEYRFSRTEHLRIASRRIYNFFVLPTEGVVMQMEQVRRATGDYRHRPYGAAQIQIIMDSSTPEAERQRILGDMLQVLGPVIEVLQLKQEGIQE
jgi:hypothetical protein